MIVTVSEGQPIPIPRELDRAKVTMRLMRVSEESSLEIFRIKKGVLHAGYCVGSIGVGALRIDIHPKASSGEPAAERRFLLNMLRVAGYLVRCHAQEGGVQRAFGNPAEAIIREVSLEMLDVLRDGTPRRYEERDEESATVRGRIDFTRLSTRLPSSQILLPVRFAPLNIDNELSRMIKWTAKRLFSITRSTQNREALARVLSYFADVKDTGDYVFPTSELVLSRYEARWKETIAIGTLLAMGHTTDPTASGKEHVFSLVFPLQHLFERCLRNLLRKSVEGVSIEISHKTNKLYLLENNDTGKKLARLRPDYVMKAAGAVIAIADAKWKRLSEMQRGHGIELADLYQVNAYLTRYGVDTAILLFPKASWMNSQWVSSYGIPDTNRKVHIVAVDIEALVSRDSVMRDKALQSLRYSILQMLKLLPHSTLLGATPASLQNAATGIS